MKRIASLLVITMGFIIGNTAEAISSSNIQLEYVSNKVQVVGDEEAANRGEFSVTYKVSAIDQDVYIFKDAATSTIVTTAGLPATGRVLLRELDLVSGGSETNDAIIIKEGESARLRLTTIFENTASTAISARMILTSLFIGSSQSRVSNTVFVPFSYEDFRTSALLLLAKPVNTTSAEAFQQYERKLAVGSRGADVVQLQTFLESRNYLVMEPGVSKGYFGESTKVALAKYQQHIGLTPANGYFGARSIHYFNNANGIKVSLIDFDKSLKYELVSQSIQSDSEQTVGTFSLRVKVTSTVYDMYIKKGGVNIKFINSSGNEVNKDVKVLSQNVTLVSGATEKTNSYLIQEDGEAIFEIKGTFENMAKSTSSYGVALQSFFIASADNSPNGGYVETKFGIDEKVKTNSIVLLGKNANTTGSTNNGVINEPSNDVVLNNVMCYSYINLSTWSGAKSQNIKSVDFIKNLQASLIKIGYSNVTVSGKYDSYTNQSIIDYKKKRNMTPATSEISARFIDAVSADLGCTKSGELFAKIWKKPSDANYFAVDGSITLNGKVVSNSNTYKVERNSVLNVSLWMNAYWNDVYPVDVYKKELTGVLTSPATVESESKEYEIFKIPATYNCENSEVEGLHNNYVNALKKYNELVAKAEAASNFDTSSEYKTYVSYLNQKILQAKVVVAASSKLDPVFSKCANLVTDSGKKNARYFNLPRISDNQTFASALVSAQESLNRDFTLPKYIQDGTYILEIKSPTKRHKTEISLEVKGGEFVPMKEIEVQDRPVSINLPKNVWSINETNSIDVTVKEGVSPTGINVFIADVIGDGSVNKNISKNVIPNAKIVDGKISFSPKHIAHLPTNTDQKFAIYLQYKNRKEKLTTNYVYITTVGAKDVKERVVKINKASIALVKNQLNVSISGAGFTARSNSLSLRVNESGKESIVIPNFAVGLGGTTGTLSWNVPASRLVCEQGNTRNCYTFPQSAAGISYEVSVNNAGGESEFFPVVATSIGAQVAATAPNEKSIAVTYPNGGEKLSFGAKDVDFRTTWSSTGITGEMSIYLSLSTGELCLVGRADAKTGVLTKKLGSNYKCPNIAKKITDGEYKVFIHHADKATKTIIKDYSDDFFTVTNGATTNTGNTTTNTGGNTSTSGSGSNSDSGSSDTTNTSTGSSDVQSDTNDTGVSSNPSLVVIAPITGISKKAGDSVVVKADFVQKDIPNNAKVKIYLVGDGTMVQLGNERAVRVCPPYPQDCSYLKTNGIIRTIPRTTQAGSYRIKVTVIRADGVTVSAESGVINVTAP